ncbi:MAG: Na+/H+ antiporter subunit E [Deltaproteobacteria bacterium]|jgi:multicomponent Na+:H+ antiporter subunit E
MISLTPGTLSVDLSEDRKIIFVHVIFLDDMVDYLTGILMIMGKSFACKHPQGSFFCPTL